MSSPENKEGPQYRSFTLGEVLFFATGGLIVSPKHRDDFDSILDMAAYMTGLNDVHFLELEGIVKRCQDTVVAQHPKVEAIAQKIKAGEIEPLWQASDGDPALLRQLITDWLDSQEEEPGTLLELKPLDNFTRDKRTIAQLAVDAFDPRHLNQVFLATKDDQGNIIFPD